MIFFDALEKIDPANKTVMITGANSGLGYEVARYFAKANAHVLLCSRSLEKGQQAKSKILQEYSDSNVTVHTLDLADRSSIDTFVDHLQQQQVKIDFLINNAGIMATPYALTKDGYESQIGVNHLGHFILTAKLFELLNKHARIVNVSSMAYQQGTMDKQNFMFEHGHYSPFRSYARSKLANILFTFALARRLENNHKEIVVVAAHPGVARTSLFDRKASMFTKFLKLFEGILPTAEMGAKAILAAALDKQAKPATFYGPIQSKKYQGNKIRLEQVNQIADNIENQEACWSISSSLTNHPFAL